MTDDNNSKKWVFPALNIEPGERLLIFASGKNRRDLPAGTPNHWETAANESDDWQYFIGTAEPSSKWNYLTFNALANWTTAPGPFGYGDGDDTTQIPAGTLSIYFRKNFDVPDASKLTRAILSMDYDDGFVAYLNGIEIARSQNISGTPDYQTLATPDHEAAIYGGGDAESFPISPSILAAALKNGSNVLAIELHNVNDVSSDLSGRAWLHFGIADGSKFFGANPVWFTAAGDNVPEMHTNFKISNSETIKLYDPPGQILDSIFIENLQPGHVRARISDGDSWCFSNQPTPGQANAGVCFKGYAPVPIFNLKSGFYTENQSVAISGGGNIRFTTDGKNPSDTSEIYQNPIEISKSGVVRARSFQAQRLPSAVATASYFVNEPTTLPVVSIAVPPGDFFENGDGGAAVYDKKTGKTGVTVEYFDAAKNRVFSENASARVVGNYSVDFPQKSLQFEFSSEFGAAGEVPNIFQKDKPAVKNLHGFRIRNQDDDAASARMRDLVSNRISNATHCATTGYENVAAFINGEYWGHYGAREMMNRWFVRDNFDADPDSVEIITTQYAAQNPYEATTGTDVEFFKMSDFIIQNSLAGTSNWLRADSLIDWRNWVDYFATEIYIENGDWFPSMYFNNTRLFRAPDLKWKFVLWDTNYGQRDPADNLLDATLANPAQQNRYTDMMNRLLGNSNFKNYFINRFADLLNDHFKTQKIHAVIDENAAQLAPEIEAQNNRWGSGDLATWQDNVQNLKYFHSERTAFVRDHIQNHFDMAGKVNITLKTVPAGAGFVQISTLTPTDLPWTGVYFNGNPVKLTAIAAPGFSFSNWSANPFISNLTVPNFTSNISTNTTFTANFTGASTAPELVISEINYHSDTLLNSGDWLEIFNPGTAPLDLSGWSIEDETPLNKYVFPTGTNLAAGARLVLFEDLDKFQAVHPNVSNKIGPISFGLSNSGEQILIRNFSKDTFLIVKYKDGSKWPCTPDGFGRTLELSNLTADPNEPESWFAGCIGGSPGKAFSACLDFPVISEINYHSDPANDAGDWFEIFNQSSSALNLGGWVFRDSDDKNFFTIPANTTVPVAGRIVFFNDLAKFSAEHPTVQNKVGAFNFGFANSSDVVRLYDSGGNLRHSVCYLDSLPWPVEADGLGKTLEFKIGESPNLPGSWFAGCPGGSPGAAFDPNCSIATDEISDGNLSLEIFPNPAGEFVFVKILGEGFSQKFDVQISDAIGRTVFLGNNFENGGQLSVKNLSSGVYQVSCRAENGRLVLGRFFKN